jgi:hypothetical protein
MKLSRDEVGGKRWWAIRSREEHRAEAIGEEEAGAGDIEGEIEFNS